MSYGKDGLGAYLKSGGQINPADAGTDEATNIRSLTDTPTIHFKSKATGKLGEANYYDDIVRFKSRYQLMDDNDRNTPAYAGPDMALSHDAVSPNTQLVFGKFRCGGLKSAIGTFPAVTVSEPKFIAFTPNNNNIFVYHTNECKLYSIVDNVLADVLEATPVPECPAAATKGALSRETGLLVLNDTTAPYLHAWRMIGNVSNARFTKLTDTFLPALTGIPDFISITDNGNFIAVAKINDYKRIYVRKDDGYKALSNMPDTGYTAYGNAISPDGRYYVISEESGGNTTLHVWRYVAGEFVLMTGGGFTFTGLETPSVLTFSPSSEFIAVTGDAPLYKLSLIYLDPSLDSMPISIPLNMTQAPTAIAFSADSSFLAVATGEDDVDSLRLYRRSGAGFVADTVSTSFSFNSSSASNHVAMANNSNGLKTCLIPGGGSIASGDSIQAFNVANGTAEDCSASEFRYCNNGILSGTYTNPTCDIIP